MSSIAPLHFSLGTPSSPFLSTRRGESCLMCKLAKKGCSRTYNDLGECQRCFQLGIPCFGEGERRPSWFEVKPYQTDETRRQRAKLKDVLRNWNRRRRGGKGEKLCLCDVEIIADWFPNGCLSQYCKHLTEDATTAPSDYPPPPPFPVPAPSATHSPSAYNSAFTFLLPSGIDHANIPSVHPLFFSVGGEAPPSPALSLVSLSTFGSASDYDHQSTNDGSIPGTPGTFSSSFPLPPTNDALESSSNAEAFFSHESEYGAHLGWAERPFPTLETTFLPSIEPLASNSSGGLHPNIVVTAPEERTSDSTLNVIQYILGPNPY